MNFNNNNNNKNINELYNDYDTLMISDLDSVITHYRPDSSTKSSQTVSMSSLGNAITTTMSRRKAPTANIQKRKKVMTALTYGEDLKKNPRKEQTFTSPSTTSNLVVLTNDEKSIKKHLPATNKPSSTTSNLVVLTNDEKSVKKFRPTGQQSTSSRNTNSYQRVRRELTSVVLPRNSPTSTQNQFISQVPKDVNYYGYNESYVQASPAPNKSSSSTNDIYQTSYPHSAIYNQNPPTKDVYRIPPPQRRYERKSPPHSRLSSETVNRDSYRRDQFGTEHRDRSRSPVDRYDTESRYRRTVLSPDRETFRRRSRRSRSVSRDRNEVDSGCDRNTSRSPTFNYRRRSRSPVDRYDKYYDQITSRPRSTSNHDRDSTSPGSRPNNKPSPSKNRTDADKESTVVENSPKTRSLNNPGGEDRRGTELTSNKAFTKSNLKMFEELSGTYKNTIIPEVINTLLEPDLKIELLSDDEDLEDDKATEPDINIKDILLSLKFAGEKRGQQSTDGRAANHRTEKSTNIKVIVVHNDFPFVNLTEEQVECIQISLVDHIKPGDQGTGPQFDGIQLEEGTMIVTCKNLESKIWLENTIPKLRCDGETLRTVTSDDLATRGFKFGIQLPHPMPGKSPRDVLDLIKAQNVGLYTDNWRIVDSKETPQGMNIVVYADQASLKGLLKCNMNPCVGLHRAKIIGNSEPK